MQKLESPIICYLDFVRVFRHLRWFIIYVFYQSYSISTPPAILIPEMGNFRMEWQNGRIIYTRKKFGTFPGISVWLCSKEVQINQMAQNLDHSSLEYLLSWKLPQSLQKIKFSLCSEFIFSSYLSVQILSIAMHNQAA